MPMFNLKVAPRARRLREGRRVAATHGPGTNDVVGILTLRGGENRTLVKSKKLQTVPLSVYSARYYVLSIQHRHFSHLNLPRLAGLTRARTQSLAMLLAKPNTISKQFLPSKSHRLSPFRVTFSHLTNTCIACRHDGPAFTPHSARRVHSSRDSMGLCGVFSMSGSGHWHSARVRRGHNFVVLVFSALEGESSSAPLDLVFSGLVFSTLPERRCGAYSTLACTQCSLSSPLRFWHLVFDVVRTFLYSMNLNNCQSMLAFLFLWIF